LPIVDDARRDASDPLVTEDTTQPDAERRGGLIELLVVASTLRKLRLRDVTSTGAANMLQRKRSTRRSDAGSINANRRQSIASK
jgi:hypothetical protein